MKIRTILKAIFLCTFLFFTQAAYATSHDVEYFSDSNIISIQSKLIEVGGKLYGTSLYGGSNNYGTIFEFNPNTETFNILHSFNNTNGANTSSGLTYYLGKLYGVATYGSTNDNGLIFSINTDGTGFTEIYSFGDGDSQVDDLVIINDTIYGTVREAGVHGYIFSININGTGFDNLHAFTGGVGDGSNPWSGLTYYNNKLYGNTVYGGVSDNGVIFSIDLDGTNYSVLASFEAQNGVPSSKLVLHNNVLYGTTEYTGANNYGTLYKINPDGSGYSTFFSFSCVGSVPCYPEGSLLSYEGELYGIGSYVNEAEMGNVFSLTDFNDTPQLLRELVTTNGFNPYYHPALIEFDGKLWGTVDTGGELDYGGIFSYLLPDSTPPELVSISPTSGATIVDKTPLIEITLNEIGSCRASLSDESYSDMSDDFDCTGDNSTNISCQIPSLGKDGNKHIYVSCIDANNNSNSSSNNFNITYKLSTSNDEEVNENNVISQTGSTDTNETEDSNENNDSEENDIEMIEIIVTDTNKNILPNTKIVINDSEYFTNEAGILSISKELVLLNPNISYTYNGKKYSGNISEGKLILNITNIDSEDKVVNEDLGNSAWISNFNYSWIILIIAIIITLIYINRKLSKD